MTRVPVPTAALRAFFLLLALMAAWATPRAVHAQHAYHELIARYAQAHVYHEALAVPGDAGPVLVVPFRIPNSRLIFVRSEAAGRPFTAQVEVTVQVYRRGQKVAEEVWKHEHVAATFEEAQQRDKDVQGMVQFTLPPGRYGYRLLVKDASLRGGGALTPVVLPDFATTAVGSGFVVAQAASEMGALRLAPANVGGALPYGAAVRLAVPFVVPAGDQQGPVEVSYRLFLIDPASVRKEARKRKAAAAQTRSDEGVLPVWLPEADLPALPKRPVRAGTVAPADLIPIPPTHPVATDGTLTWPAGAASVARLALIDPESVALEDGTYVLETTVRAGTWEQVATTRLETHWRDMPYSLYSPEVAIRNLAFLEERKQVRAMLRGGTRERETRIRAYWAERDPTPGTAFNELMAEYYRRIDHAAFAFKTGRNPVPDGLDTDRARVYILHGPPDSIDRSVPPSGGVREVWQYAGGQRFIFWALGGLDALELQEDRSR